MTRRCTLPLGMVDGTTADAIVRFKIEKRIKRPENAVFAWLRLPKREQVRRVAQLFREATERDDVHAAYVAVANAFADDEERRAGSPNGCKDE